MFLVDINACTDEWSLGIFVWQFLLGYAGPTSNVRVERASLDRFRNDSAVDEIVSIYEDLSARNIEDDKENRVEVAGEKISCLTVHVCHLISKTFNFCL